jgi:hypothetical protein
MMSETVMRDRLRRFCVSSLFVLAVPLLTATSSAEQGVQGNAIERFQTKLDSGAVKVASPADKLSYLRSVLDGLGIDPESQLLVFSAGSLQFNRISQSTPRAIYHGDDVSVGWVQNSDLMEFIVSGGGNGLAFYTLDTAAQKPKFERRGSECVICHGFASRWAAGLMVANMDTGPGGSLLGLTPNRIFSLTDQRTPFDQRYGGWYVTGETGDMAHRGNVTQDPDHIGVLPSGGRNLLSLSDRLDIAKYLAPSSDIVSLLTMEHQAGFVTLVAQINAQYRGLNNNALADVRLRATQADIDTAIEELIRYMTFADEVALPSPVRSATAYAERFVQRGPRDEKGRSLRELDLRRSVFRYPLSYMIYSEAFDSLTTEAKARVWRRLYEVLSGKDKSPVFARAARDGRAAIAIVAATKADVPAYWKTVI